MCGALGRRELLAQFVPERRQNGARRHSLGFAPPHDVSGFKAAPPTLPQKELKGKTLKGCLSVSFLFSHTAPPPPWTSCHQECAAGPFAVTCAKESERVEAGGWRDLNLMAEWSYCATSRQRRLHKQEGDKHNVEYDYPRQDDLGWRRRIPHVLKKAGWRRTGASAGGRLARPGFSISPL